MRQTVLVTGACGFLGRYICERFRAGGSLVVGVDVLSDAGFAQDWMDYYVSLDLPNPQLGAILQKLKPGAFIHCAGRASVPLSMTEPLNDFKSNAVLVVDILDQLRTSAPECAFLLFSSAAVYGSPVDPLVSEDVNVNPISPYGYHKHLAELCCKEYASVFGLRTASLRIFSAYGPGLRRQVLWDLSNKLTSAVSVNLQGTGNESRDFVHAQDVANAAFLVVNGGPMQGECYNVGSGVETSIADLADLLAEALDVRCGISFSGILPSGIPSRWKADLTRIKSIGFSPAIDIEQGVRAYADWFRSIAPKELVKSV